MQILAVDFGTSNSVAVLRTDEGRTRALLFDGMPLLPSAVFADPGGALYVGQDAIHSAQLEPSRFEPNPKRRIDERTVLLGDRAYPVVELIAAVLRRVVTEAVRVCGDLPPVVLTCPAGWGPTRRGVLTAAAERAGMSVVGMVAEPVAAAAYFTAVLERKLPAGGMVGVFDFGGGTLDLAVVRRSSVSLEVVGSGGLDDLGGVDVDAAVVAHLGQQLAERAPQVWKRLSAPDTADDLRDRALLWSDARSAKEILARASSAPVPVRGHQPGMHVTRDEFDMLASPLVRRAVAATADVLHRCGVAPQSLAGLFLVGGSSRIPLVTRLLHVTLGITPTVLEQPELAVAEGALYTDVAPRLPAALMQVLREPAPPEPVTMEAAPGRHGWRVGVGIVVAAVVLAAAGTALFQSIRGIGSHANAASTGASPRAGGHQAASGSASPPMRLVSLKPSALARDADLKKFLSGWDMYPQGWRCAKADLAHTVGTVGNPANSADRGTPNESIYCKQADLELYVAHYKSGGDKDRIRYVGSTEPTTEAAYDQGMPKGVYGAYPLNSWSGTQHAVLWTDDASSGATADIGILVTNENVDLLQVWQEYAGER